MQLHDKDGSHSHSSENGSRRPMRSCSVMETPKFTVQVPPIRSNRGCWTCRLRRKKCDEGRSPGCLRCASVGVHCHYGTKPRWIDDPVLGKTEVERIKGIVGASASRKRRHLERSFELFGLHHALRKALSHHTMILSLHLWMTICTWSLGHHPTTHQSPSLNLLPVGPNGSKIMKLV